MVLAFATRSVSIVDRFPHLRLCLRLCLYFHLRHHYRHSGFTVKSLHDGRTTLGNEQIGRNRKNITGANSKYPSY